MSRAPRYPQGRSARSSSRGPNVISGYWNRPEVNAEAFRDGWFHTGDVGVLTEDGYLHVVDRLKDMIISGGENIASAEVERCLLEHPCVADAAVVGMPHEKWGEVPFAFVVIAPGKSDVFSSSTLDQHDGHTARG
jgi:acyl-CoA synthetase (AMP-forming)/AMP-acid ligase II